jgi:hypothetical protein
MSSAQSTETRGAWLWRKMAAIYGVRFLDMWAGVDPLDVQAEWTTALQGIPRERLMRGISGLWHTRNVPTLPEFIALCEPQPAMYTPHTMLPDDCRTPSDEARAKLADIAKSITRSAPVVDRGIAWAQRIVDEAAAGRVLPGNRLEVARAAIDVWMLTHGTATAHAREPEREHEPLHGQPSQREPGCDDEVVDATN